MQICKVNRQKNIPIGYYAAWGKKIKIKMTDFNPVQITQLHKPMCTTLKNYLFI